MCPANAHESTCSIPISCCNAIGSKLHDRRKIGCPVHQRHGPSNESRPYAVGPSVEFRLPAGFAVEASAIYRRIGRTYWFNFSTQTDAVGLLINRTRGNSWEFPVIGKYYFGRQIAVGPVWRRRDSISYQRFPQRRIEVGGNLAAAGSSPGVPLRARNGRHGSGGRSLPCGKSRDLARGALYTMGQSGKLNQKNNVGLFVGFGF